MFNIVVVFSDEIGKHNVVGLNEEEFNYCGYSIDKVHRSKNDTFKLLNRLKLFERETQLLRLPIYSNKI